MPYQRQIAMDEYQRRALAQQQAQADQQRDMALLQGFVMKPLSQVVGRALEQWETPLQKAQGAELRAQTAARELALQQARDEWNYYTTGALPGFVRVGDEILPTDQAIRGAVEVTGAAPAITQPAPQSTAAPTLAPKMQRGGMPGVSLGMFEAKRPAGSPVKQMVTPSPEPIQAARLAPTLSPPEQKSRFAKNIGGIPAAPAYEPPDVNARVRTVAPTAEGARPVTPQEYDRYSAAQKYIRGLKDEAASVRAGALAAYDAGYNKGLDIYKQNMARFKEAEQGEYVLATAYANASPGNKKADIELLKLMRDELYADVAATFGTSDVDPESIKKMPRISGAIDAINATAKLHGLPDKWLTPESITTGARTKQTAQEAAQAGVEGKNVDVESKAYELEYRKTHGGEPPPSGSQKDAAAEAQKDAEKWLKENIRYGVDPGTGLVDQKGVEFLRDQIVAKVGSLPQGSPVRQAYVDLGERIAPRGDATKSAWVGKRGDQLNTLIQTILGAEALKDFSVPE